MTSKHLDEIKKNLGERLFEVLKLKIQIVLTVCMGSPGDIRLWK